MESAVAMERLLYAFRIVFGTSLSWVILVCEGFEEGLYAVASATVEVR
jgi:hypothetical protein